MRKPLKKKLTAVEDSTIEAAGSRQVKQRRILSHKTKANQFPPTSLLEKYTELYDLSPVGYFTLDKDGVIQELNLSAALLLGKDRSSLLNQPFSTFVSAAHRSSFQGFFDNIFKANVKTSCEVELDNYFKPFVFVHIDGRVLSRGSQCLLAVSDISEWRKAVDALRRKHEIFELSLDLHCITDAAGFFKIVNPSWTRILGWSHEEIVAKHSIELVHPDDRNVGNEIKDSLLQGAGIMQFENRILCKDGSYRWIEWNTVPNPTDNTVISVGRDITGRKYVEEENRKLAMIANLTINAVMLTNAGGLIQWINNGFEQLTGYSLTEIKDINICDFLTQPGTFQEAVMYIRSCMKHQKACKVELLNFSRTGKAYWVDVEMVPMKDSQEQVTGFMFLEKEITERKLAETELLNQNHDLNKRAEELTLSNEELERFAYVASHDLQEPLRMVSGFMQLLKRNYDPLLDEKAREYVRFAVDGADRMKRLIMDLLEYSRVGTNKEVFQPTDLNGILREIELVFECPGHEPQLTLTYPMMPVILANRPQVVQLFQNLLGNAVKYRSTVKPRVEINYKEDADQYLFSVTDNGIGIATRYFEKIFILFQRLHVEEEYSGTGIGLAICKKIVEVHGGNIWVESTEGKGSTFFFTIKKPD